MTETEKLSGEASTMKLVTLTHFINPHHFWCYQENTPPGYLDSIRSVEQKLITLYGEGRRTSKRFSRLKIGTTVAVKYFAFQRYIRGTVLSANRSNYIVWAMDYGLTLRTWIGYIYPLPEDSDFTADHVFCVGIANLLPAKKTKDMWRATRTVPWGQLACGALEKAMQDAVSIALVENFTIDKHCWGDLKITNNFGCSMMASEFLLQLEVAVRAGPDFREICMMLRTTQATLFCSNDGRYKFQDNICKDDEPERAQALNDRIEAATMDDQEHGLVRMQASGLTDPQTARVVRKPTSNTRHRRSGRRQQQPNVTLNAACSEIQGEGHGRRSKNRRQNTTLLVNPVSPSPPTEGALCGVNRMRQGQNIARVQTPSNNSKRSDDDAIQFEVQQSGNEQIAGVQQSNITTQDESSKIIDSQLMLLEKQEQHVIWPKFKAATRIPNDIGTTQEQVFQLIRTLGQDGRKSLGARCRLESVASRLLATKWQGSDISDCEALPSEDGSESDSKREAPQNQEPAADSNAELSENQSMYYKGCGAADSIDLRSVNKVMFFLDTGEPTTTPLDDGSDDVRSLKEVDGESSIRTIFSNQLMLAHSSEPLATVIKPTAEAYPREGHEQLAIMHVIRLVCLQPCAPLPASSSALLVPQLIPAHKSLRTVWYQTDCLIYVKIHAPDIDDYYLSISADTVHFDARVDGERSVVILNLLGTVEPQYCTHVIRGPNVVVCMIKSVYMKWPRLLHQSTEFDWLAYDISTLEPMREKSPSVHKEPIHPNQLEAYPHNDGEDDDDGKIQDSTDDVTEEIFWI